MPVSEAELRARYDDDDRKNDIVSVAEAWFTRSESLSATVEHFERFPRFTHEDGIEVKPDFAVLFKDGTGLAGELSSIALVPESIDGLCRQIGRYAELTQLPSAPKPDGGHDLKPVSDIDVVLFVPHRVANACIDRLDKAIADDNHSYSPPRHPMVLAWSYDAGEDSYTFARDERGGKNPLVPSHAREPTLSTWLEASNDTLRGLPKHFGGIKVARRFVNDEPSELYTATILWTETLPSMLGTKENGELETELEASAAEIAEAMRDRYGFGRAEHVDKVLRFLRRARLAQQVGERWRIAHREISRSAPDVRDALIARVTTKSARAMATQKTADAEDGEPEAETLFDGEDETRERGV